MTTKDLRNSIEKVLGNNIRCLLPSYWWKRLFHQVADTIDEVNGVDIVSSEYALNRVDAPIGSLASIANKKAMKPSECYVPTDEDSNLTDEELVAKLTRLTSLEVSFPLPDITGVEAVAVLASEDAWLGFLVISEDFCAAIFAESPTNEKTFLLTSQSSVNSLNTFLKQHKFYYVGLDFEPEDTEEYIKETTELYDQIFTIVDCTSDVYVKGLAWERLAKEGESGSASVPSYTLYYTTYKVNEVTTMADKYINLNKEEYAKIFASQKAKENYLLQVVELGSHSEEFAPVDVELSWFSLADLNYADADFNVIVCSFLQMDGANQPQRRLVSFKSDGTAEYELIPTGDVKFLYYADGTYSLSAKEKAHNASAILSIKNSFDSSFTPSPIIIRYKIGSTKYLSLQGILSGNDAEGDGVSLTAFASDNVYFRFNYDLATGEPAKAKVIKTVDSELSDTSENPVQNKVVTEKLAELSEEIADVSEEVTKSASAVSGTMFKLIKGSYVATSGAIVADAAAYRTDYVDVTATFKIKGRGSFYGTGLVLAFFDKDKNFINDGWVRGSDGNPMKDLDSYIPAKARYAIVSAYGATNAELSYLQTTGLIGLAKKDVHKKVLVFGDSITETQTITFASEENPYSLTYKTSKTNWVDYFQKQQNGLVQFDEVRNYARSGARFIKVSGGQEARQFIGFQIDEAISDLNAPSDGYFYGKDFLPDIIVVSMGTNDYETVSSKSYEDAMARSIMSGSDIDVDATIENLRNSIFAETVRKSFMRIKKQFPLAKCYMCLPLQRKATEFPSEILECLRKMSARYGFTIIDCYGESGITRDFADVYLSDGLHPNSAGKELMGRFIVNRILADYHY